MKATSKTHLALVYASAVAIAFGTEYVREWISEPKPSCYEVASGVSEHVACARMDMKVMWAEVKHQLKKEGVW